MSTVQANIDYFNSLNEEAEKGGADAGATQRRSIPQLLGEIDRLREDVGTPRDGDKDSTGYFNKQGMALGEALKELDGKKSVEIGQLKQAIDNANASLNTRIDGVSQASQRRDSEISEELASNKADADANIGSLRAEMETKLSGVKSELDESLLTNNAGSDAKLSSLERSLDENLRNIGYVSTSTETASGEFQKIRELIDRANKERETGDAELTQSIDLEKTRAQDAEQNLGDTLARTKAEVDANIGSFKAEMQTKLSDVKSEVNESLLRNNAGSDAKLSSLERSLDENLRTIGSVGTSTDTAFGEFKTVRELIDRANKERETGDAELERNLGIETGRAEEQEFILKQNLDTEIKRSIGEDIRLKEALSGETDRARGAEQGLKTELDAEVKTRTDKDTQLEQVLADTSEDLARRIRGVSDGSKKRDDKLREDFEREDKELGKRIIQEGIERKNESENLGKRIKITENVLRDQHERAIKDLNASFNTRIDGVSQGSQRRDEALGKRITAEATERAEADRRIQEEGRKDIIDLGNVLRQEISAEATERAQTDTQLEQALADTSEELGKRIIQEGIERANKDTELSDLIDDTRNKLASEQIKRVRDTRQIKEDVKVSKAVAGLQTAAVKELQEDLENSNMTMDMRVKRLENIALQSVAAINELAKELQKTKKAGLFSR